MKRLFRPETLFFLLTWLVLMLAFRERGFYDPGSLWHIKVGEIILNEGMPHTDPFSYTFEGRGWVPQQWGAEVLMALTHQIGGFDAMLLAFATLIAALYTLIFRRAMQAGMGPILAGLMVGVCLFVGAFHYFVRPHMFTIILLGWTMVAIIDYERGRCSEWRLIALIPLYILWTNLHGGVLGGTMTVGLAVAGWGVLFLKSRIGKTQVPGQTSESATPIRNWRTAFLLCGIVVACGLTPFINPHGLEMIRIWQRIVASKVLPAVVHEHMPLNPTEPLGLAIIGLGAFYLILLLGTLPRRPQVTWLIPLVWFALSFKGIRQGPLFAITAAVAMADLWPHTIWHRLLVKYGDGSLARSPNFTPRPLVAPFIVPALAILAALCLDITHTPAPLVGYGWVKFDPDFVPVDLNGSIEEYAAHVPAGTRVFNDANLGGYLIYHAPSLKIFMDDRCELYGDDWIKGYADTLGLPPGELGVVFEHWATDYQFDRALVMTNPPEKEKPSIERYLLGNPQKWREVARGKRAVMFERIR
ncbi:MAG TPA: hypothetical protein VG122_04525 [Gemmata sp.]|nr:hypothetical protein [Gemmata sp.]